MAGIAWKGASLLPSTQGNTPKNHRGRPPRDPVAVQLAFLTWLHGLTLEEVHNVIDNVLWEHGKARLEDIDRGYHRGAVRYINAGRNRWDRGEWVQMEAIRCREVREGVWKLTVLEPNGDLWGYIVPVDPKRVRECHQEAGFRLSAVPAKLVRTVNPHDYEREVEKLELLAKRLTKGSGRTIYRRHEWERL